MRISHARCGNFLNPHGINTHSLNNHQSSNYGGFHLLTEKFDRNPVTGGGNRTHVAVPKNLLTTEALYHSATEVLIEFGKYFGSRVV